VQSTALTPDKRETGSRKARLCPRIRCGPDATRACRGILTSVRCARASSSSLSSAARIGRHRAADYREDAATPVRHNA
jgi:hypothetical protein